MSIWGGGYGKGDSNKTRVQDEFDIVANSINSMRTQLSHSYSSLQMSLEALESQTRLLKESQRDLEELLKEREGHLENERNHKLQLEKKVAERTSELQESTHELKVKSASLEQSLEELKKTQARLIETEKDESDVHQMLELVLSGFEFKAKTLRVHHAYSIEEAKVKLESIEDLAVMLLDVSPGGC